MHTDGVLGRKEGELVLRVSSALCLIAREVTYLPGCVDNLAVVFDALVLDSLIRGRLNSGVVLLVVGGRSCELLGDGRLA